MRAARTAPALLAALVLAAGAAACGDDGSGSGGGGNGKRETVEVGTLPIASAAPLYLGRQKGFFREEGLEVKPQLQ